MGWFESVEHSRWLSAQMQALLEQGHPAVATTGFGHFNEQGHVDTDRPVDLTITARATYVYSLGVLMGIPGCRKYSDHGVKCLADYFEDPEYGGWFASIDHKPNQAGHGVPWGEGGARKWQYGHAMLLLAASTAAEANRPGAHQLLTRALENQEKYWFDKKLVRDEYNRDWSKCSDRRTLNCLVHSVEAYLAAAEATAKPEWVRRAVGILDFVNQMALTYDGRVPENYDKNWRPLLDFNRDDPGVHYAPYGYVIGHGMHLARLSLEAHAAVRSLGHDSFEFLSDTANLLFDRARADGWRKDGNAGFIYSANFEGEPVIKDRFQWVVCEGIAAAAAMRRSLIDDGAGPGEIEVYEHCYRSWLDYLHDAMQIKPGVYVRVLSETNEPIAGSIPLRPDIYHALQAMLITRLPLWPTFATALSHNLLDKPTPPAPDKRSWRRRLPW